jgi:hypothetical protein
LFYSLTICSLFDDQLVKIKEPRDGDILIRGETFTLVAEVEADSRLSAINVGLFVTAGITENPYDSLLWSYVVEDEGVNITGKIEIEKEIMVPPDAPLDDSYFLQVTAIYGGGSGYAWTSQVSVLDSEY